MRFKKLVVLLSLLVYGNANAQNPWETLAKKTSTLGLDQGFLNLKSTAFQLKLVKSSQTLAALKPITDTAFNFSPEKFLKTRSSDGAYQLGDINLRIKVAGGEWQKYSTATKRAAVTALPVSYQYCQRF